MAKFFCDVVDELLILLAALGGLGEEADGAREIDGVEVGGCADDDGGAAGLAGEAHHLGVAGLAEDDYLAADPLHLVVALADTLLERQHDGACGVDELDAELLGGAIGFGRFAVGADEHLGAWEGGEAAVVDHHEPEASEPLHLGAVVDDIAQTVETAVAGELVLGGADSLHHPEAIACVVVDPDIHSANSCFDFPGERARAPRRTPRG